MWTCLIKVTFRHQKDIIKMCTKVTVTPCLYICTNLKIAKSYFSCQFMHRKDKFEQSAVPVQNRFVKYWRSYIHIVPYFLLFIWWRNELLTAELHLLSLFITHSPKIAPTPVISLNILFPVSIKQKTFNG